MAVLKARHGQWPAGHWVVMSTEISGVRLLAIAFAWSQKSISFFISTIGTTAPALESYASNFEDEYGNTCSKLIQRPEIVDFIYRFLPVNDNHNKSRQHLLKPEKKWPTKDCWFRLFTSLLGFAVVDLYRIYRFHDEETWKEYTIIQFSNMICNGLLPRGRARLPDGLKNAVEGAEKVERITDPNNKAFHSKAENGQALPPRGWNSRTTHLLGMLHVPLSYW
jgi:hypothetical protein